MPSIITAGDATNQGVAHTGGSDNALTIRVGPNAGKVDAQVIDGTGRTGFKVAAPTAFVHTPAGTAAAGTAGLKITTGVVLTTPEAGAFEKDSKVLYATPSDTSPNRALNTTQFFYQKNSSTAFGNVATAQNWLNVGITLEAGTTYLFEGEFNLVDTGVTSHTLNTLFGGTATLTAIEYQVTRSINNVGQTVNRFAVATSNATSGATTTAQTNMFWFKGTVTINAGGTFIPQFNYSVAPGAGGTVSAGAWFYLTPLGGSGIINVGNWA